MELTDNAQRELYFANSVVNPNGKYEYDALYRLVKAVGWEHYGQGQLGNHLQSANLELDYSAAIITYEEIACDSRRQLIIIRNSEQYHPFGTSAYHLSNSSSEVSLKRYRYVGKERDDESGLYYYGARYYAAWLCRFVSVDPLKDDYPMWSSYVYAGNMPVTLTDVNGEGPGETHEVVSGDTLGELAHQYGTTVEALLAANEGLIKDRDHIEIGWNINLPGNDNNLDGLTEAFS